MFKRRNMLVKKPSYKKDSVEKYSIPMDYVFISIQVVQYMLNHSWWLYKIVILKLF